MEDLIIKEKSEDIVACILIDENNEESYCIYHDDDGGEKLIFTKNKNDLSSIEDFSGYTIEQIKEHISKYGCEIEPNYEMDDFFEDVIYLDNLPNSYIVYLKTVKIEQYKKIIFRD